MKPKTKKILNAIYYTVCVLIIGTFAYFAIGFITILGVIGSKPTDTNNMAATTVYWARLADFPKEAKSFEIEAGGSAMTRSFKGSFILESQTLDLWIKHSPGLKDAKVETVSQHIKKYIIKPKEALYAEVIINEKTGKVEFHTYWS